MSDRERLARLVDPEAFTDHAITWRAGPGDFPSNWQPRRETAYSKADALMQMLAEARAGGRAEAAGAITWDTTCLNCAKLLDSSYGEYVKGHKAGRAEGAAEVRAQVEVVLTGEWGSDVPEWVATDLRAALTDEEQP